MQDPRASVVLRPCIAGQVRGAAWTAFLISVQFHFNNLLGSGTFCHAKTKRSAPSTRRRFKTLCTYVNKLAGRAAPDQTRALMATTALWSRYPIRIQFSFMRARAYHYHARARQINIILGRRTEVPTQTSIVAYVTKAALAHLARL